MSTSAARKRIVAIALGVALAAAACGDDGTSEVAGTTTGPELGEAEADLAASLHCADEPRHLDATAILLVPGTGLNGEEAFDRTLAPALADAGHDVCTVDLVEAATGDIQRSAEHVVAALREMTGRGHDDIAVVAFSQGVLATRWALAWWSDTNGPVTDLIGIAGPNGGAATTAPLCGEGCAAALHQMTPGSAFLGALDAAWASVTDVSVTMVASRTDTVIAADEVAAVEGATVVVVQDLCPDSTVDHVALLAEPVVAAVISDAIASDGPADADRIDASVCGADAVASGGWDPDVVTQAAFGAILAATPLDDEPPLATYAG